MITVCECAYADDGLHLVSADSRADQERQAVALLNTDTNSNFTDFRELIKRQ